jgi:cation:H+ antiporter
MFENNIWLASLFVPIGFVLLIKGANLLVDGASSIAKRFRIPDLIIGLTIVAFGTSAPELVVCIIATIKGNGGIAAGNIIGSNIANICLVLGVAGILSPMAFQKSTIWRDIPFLLLSTFILLFIILANNLPHLVSKQESVILIALMAAYMFCMFKTAGKGIEDELQSVESSLTPIRSLIMILCGFVGLVIGGKLIVWGSVLIASSFGVSQEMIGLSIVALGTSLPELATAIVAVKKNKADIAVGNIIGSNIFNIALVLGITGVISPINTTQSLNNDMFILTGTTLLLVIFMFTGKRNKIDRWEAIILAIMYVLYIGYVINRG